VKQRGFNLVAAIVLNDVGSQRQLITADHCRLAATSGQENKRTKANPLEIVFSGSPVKQRGLTSLPRLF
jgi:hypothetical protein